MSLNPKLTDWQGRVVWLVGASSGIGLATAKAMHALGAKVCVSARNEAALQAFVQAHPGTHALPLDVTDAAALREATQRIVAEHGELGMVVFCAGAYTAMRASQFDLAKAQHIAQVNYGGMLNLLDAVLPQLRRQKHGHLSIVASVAGYRGLPQSLAYGPTKAALINLAEVLYMDLRDQGVAVSLVNPGFVDTPLTQSNGFHMPALMTPDQAAQAMLKGWAKGLFEIHFPRRFTLWLKAVKHLPDWVYFMVVRRATGL